MNPKTRPSSPEEIDPMTRELIDLVEEAMRLREKRFPRLQAKQERLVQMIRDGTFFARPADMND